MPPPSAPLPTQHGCPRCGAPLPADGSGGAEPLPCGACLLLAGLGEGSSPPPPPAAPAPAGAPVDAAPAPDGLGLQLGGHVLVRQLGQGSMGVIYEARQPGTGRPVALKTISHVLADDPDVRVRFAREAEAAASLDHPYILPVYEVGEDGGRPYFTMKLAEGGSLLKVLPRHAGRPREAVALMAKVARGIAHAHGRGVLHRDLKPGNVLLDGDGETPLVSDFGLARWLDRDSDLTQSLVVFGTPGYMAPEQARHAGRAGPAADVYSLGAMLFQLLCGRTPFRGGNAIEVIEQAAAGPAPRLRSFNPKAARDLETICARCLEIEPASRPRCAADLADDLERWLAGRPIRLRPVRLPERAWRWSGRNPWLTGAAVGCALLGAFAGAWHRESVRLGTVLREKAAVRASVALLPLEQIDDATLPTLEGARVGQELVGVWRRAAPEFRLVPAGSGPAERSHPLDPADLRAVRERVSSPAILTGTLRRRDGGTRIALRLLDVSDGAVLGRWFGQCDGPKDLPGTLERAAGSLVGDLKRARQAQAQPPVDPADRTRSASARDYLRYGRELYFRLSPGTTEQAIECFQKAVAADPDYALAHAMLATACNSSSGLHRSEARLTAAREAAERAIRLDPSLAEGHRALGMYYFYQGDVPDALECDLRAYELEPENARVAGAIGFQWQQAGRPELALGWFERAARRDPQPGAWAAYIGNALMELGDDAGARVAFQRSREFRPGLAEGRLGLARLSLLGADYPTARAECEQVLELDSANPHPQTLLAQVEFFSRRNDRAEALYRELARRNRTGGCDFAGCVQYLAALGDLCRRRGAEEEGRTLLKEARDALEAEDFPMDVPGRLYARAAIHASLGERDAALATLEQAIAAGWVDYRTPTLDPRFDSVSGTPEFRDILDRLARKLEAFRRQRPVAATAQVK